MQNFTDVFTGSGDGLGGDGLGGDGLGADGPQFGQLSGVTDLAALTGLTPAALFGVGVGVAVTLVLCCGLCYW